MLTISRDDSHVFAALRAGAAGYLLKDTETERLPSALRDVMAGEAALPDAGHAPGRGVPRPRAAAARADAQPRGRAAPDLARVGGARADAAQDDDGADRAHARRLAGDGALARRRDPAQAARPDRASLVRLFEKTEVGGR